MSAFVISDTHFGHAKMLEFMRPDGERLRPFASLEEMHQTLVERWNNVVHAKDRIYVLGDVAIPRSGLHVLDRLNGSKVLVRGNHDIFKFQDYAKYFHDIRGAFFRDGLIYTHIPVHPANLTGRYIGNVHGHLHCHLIRHDDGSVDKRYFNACVEVNNFMPVALDCIQNYFGLGHGRASDVQHADQGAMERAHS
jgi:calcineurin-like phosphoesterase family protein